MSPNATPITSDPAAIAHQAHVAPETLPVRFILHMTGAEGCAVRALGLVVRRGWYLAGAELLPGRPGDARDMTIDVFQRDESRSVDTLRRQLERLYDIISVEVTDGPALTSPAPPQAPPPAPTPGPTKESTP